MLKELVKRVTPYSAIEAGRRVAFFGFARDCPVCGAKLRRLLPIGKGYPVLERLQVVGGMRRSDDRCPVCHACNRDRLIKFYLEREVFARGTEGLRITHMAPEKGLSLWISRLPGVRYLAGDIEPPRYFHLSGVRQMDLTALDLPDASVDLLICCHVLEHIPNDVAAMREIARVLAPGGRAILQVPIALKLAATVEGTGAESEAEKIRRFGQRDHVRIYTAADYVGRLTAAGLDVELWDAFEADDDAAAALRLDPLEMLHVCRPRGRSAAPA